MAHPLYSNKVCSFNVVSCELERIPKRVIGHGFEQQSAARVFTFKNEIRKVDSSKCHLERI